ncbi:MAG TPA: Bax inhibitor-1/YccA family protein, partial [Gemmatimonadales bacterium]|nr:Bax inhibitor-1/YccA family protein [Gemmatimonadales bacterium]
MPTRNPALTRANFSRIEVAEDGAVMTLAGTMKKTFILLAIMSAAMLYVWEGMPGIGLSQEVVYGLFIVGFVVGVGLLLYTASNPAMARTTGPIYAVVQGLVLGALTLVIASNPRYRGLPITAAVLTVATLAVMWVAYRTGAIKVTEKLKTIVVSCTLAIF